MSIVGEGSSSIVGDSEASFDDMILAVGWIVADSGIEVESMAMELMLDTSLLNLGALSPPTSRFFLEYVDSVSITEDEYDSELYSDD